MVFVLIRINRQLIPIIYRQLDIIVLVHLVILEEVIILLIFFKFIKKNLSEIFYFQNVFTNVLKLTLALLKQHGMQEEEQNGQKDLVFLQDLEAAALVSLILVTHVAQFVDIAMVNIPPPSSLVLSVLWVEQIYIMGLDNSNFLLAELFIY